MSPLKRMSSSKSMENLISPSGNSAVANTKRGLQHWEFHIFFSGEERNRDHPKEHMNQSVDEGKQATFPSERTRPFESSGHLFSIQFNLLDLQPMKTSLSVPVLQLEEVTISHSINKASANPN